MLIILINVLPNYRLNHLRKGRNQIFRTFRYEVRKLSIQFLHWNPDGPEMPELFVIWVQFDFGTRVSPNQRT